MVESRTSLVHSRNQEGHAEWSGHRFSLASFVTFSEVHSHVTDSLGNQINFEWFDIVKFMVLSFNSSMVNQHSGVSYDSTHSACTVSVYFSKLFRFDWLHELARHLLLNSKNHTLFSFDADRSRPVINGLECVLDLIDSALWRKSVDTTIVVLLTIENQKTWLRLTCPFALQR